jgi:lysophospholipase L1-like esterase
MLKRSRQGLRVVVVSLALLGVTAAIHGHATATATPAARPEIVLVVGDSLAGRLEPSLSRLVAPRRVVLDAVAGRTTPQGLARLRAELHTVSPTVVLISLGTNDGPNPERFRSRIRRALHAIPAGTCVVWADIHRPARKGPYRPLNSVLAREARRDPRLVIVGWSRAVARHEVLLPDGIHPDPAGFDYRSRLFSHAVERSC